MGLFAVKDIPHLLPFRPFLAQFVPDAVLFPWGSGLQFFLDFFHLPLQTVEFFSDQSYRHVVLTWCARLLYAAAFSWRTLLYYI